MDDSTLDTNKIPENHKGLPIDGSRPQGCCAAGFWFTILREGTYHSSFLCPQTLS